MRLDTSGPAASRCYGRRLAWEPNSSGLTLSVLNRVDCVAVVRARGAARVEEVHLLGLALDALEALRPALVDDVVGLLSDERPLPVVRVVGGVDRQIQGEID